jgi:acetoin utilization deacetylase AcuC-like enzyme
VHHGNGTQHIFYADPAVLFISSHEEGIYPGTGAIDEIGAGPGAGFNVNLPLPAGAGDEAFERLTAEIVEPLAARFRPHLVLVSAGFDSHWLDPLANLQLTLSGYARLTHSLMGIAQQYSLGRLALILEGGYHPAALAGGVVTVLRTLLGETGLPDSLGRAPRPEPEVGPLIARLKAIHGL